MRGFLDFLGNFSANIFAGFNKWSSKKRLVGHTEGITRQAFFGKSWYRNYIRSKRKTFDPATPSSKVLKSSDGRLYRIYSDGSYRRQLAPITVGKRKLIPV